MRGRAADMMGGGRRGASRSGWGFWRTSGGSSGVWRTSGAQVTSEGHQCRSSVISVGVGGGPTRAPPEGAGRTKLAGYMVYVRAGCPFATPKCRTKTRKQT